MNGGVKLFTVCNDSQFSGYRLLHDGAHLADAFLPRRTESDGPAKGCFRRLSLRGAAQREDLFMMLREEMPLADRMTPDTQAQFDALSVGPVFIDYEPNQSQVSI